MNVAQELIQELLRTPFVKPASLYLVALVGISLSVMVGLFVRLQTPYAGIPLENI